jgi:hypothetical protein
LAKKPFISGSGKKKRSKRQEKSEVQKFPATTASF